jgi:hypothetical protein
MSYGTTFFKHFVLLNHWTNLRSQQALCVFFISYTLSCSQHVSTLIKGHLQVMLYNTKYLKESNYLFQRIRWVHF